MAEPVSRVGMLGIGSMGRGIVTNIARGGFDVFGFDPRREALEAVREFGVRACATPAEVARQTDLILAIPFDHRQVEQAVFGEGGVVEGLQGNGLFAMMSTVGPDNARALGRRLAERGHRLVDAPVSGGARGAAEGTLTVMAGGARADLEAVEPVLRTFTANVFHVGEEVGMGQAAKLVNQLLVVTHLVATAEALSLGARSGIDPHLLTEIINASAGDSRIFRSRAPVMIDRSFKTGGSLDILVKDARLVAEVARAADTPLFVAAMAGQVMEMARALGLGAEDDASVLKAYEAIGRRAIS